MTNDNHQSPKHAFRQHSDGSVGVVRMVPGNAIMELAPKVYEIRVVDQYGNLRLFETEMRAPPKKVYGDVHDHTNRYFKRFEQYDQNLGVLFIGEKGAGKTTTLRCMMSTAQQLGMPIILIST